MPEITPETFLDSLGIIQAEENHEPSPIVKAEIEAALSLKATVSEERFIDALFISEDTAIEVLSGNRERFVASMKKTEEFLLSFGRNNLRVLDLGGGPGLISSWCAAKFADMRFDVVDRSMNTLKMGKVWSDKLGLSNIAFLKMDFREIVTKEPGYDAVLLEYVLNLHPKTKNQKAEFTEIASCAIPAIKRAMRLDGRCQIRGGSFNKAGITLLITVTRRNDVFCDLADTVSGWTGTTIVVSFEKNAYQFDRQETDAVLIKLRAHD